MLLVGLTGSIGMGKSETAKMFAKLGVPVYDADAAVHALYDIGGKAVAPIESAFPGVTKDGRIDRQALSKRVLGDPEALRRLESIIHPLVGLAQLDFLKDCDAKGSHLVVLDIPLLFETDGGRRCHAVAVVSAPAATQRERVLARPGMTEDRFSAILARQVPDAKKRRRAHMVIETGGGFDLAQAQVDDIIRALAGRYG
jgi:dephospho-CoA kinase